MPTQGVISARESQNITFTNVMGVGGSGCPRCGAPEHQVADGTYDFGGEAPDDFTLIAGPKWTWELVEQIREGLRRAAQDRTRDPVAAVAAVSPGLATGITTAVEEGLNRSATKDKAKNRRKLAWATIAFLASMMATDFSAVADNAEHVRDAVEHVLRYVAEHGSVPPAY